MAQIQCSQCGSLMDFKEGLNKKGKHYSGWFCQNKACKAVEWAKSDYKPETEKPIPTPPKIEITQNNPIPAPNKASFTASLPITDKPVDWDSKEYRMVSMNALSHAVELVRDAQSFQEPKDLSKMAEDTKSVAEEFVKWVYRKRV